MTLDELLEEHKTQYRVAKVFGFTQQRVNQWSKRNMKIPLEAQYKIHVLSDGKYKIEGQNKICGD